MPKQCVTSSMPTCPSEDVPSGVFRVSPFSGLWREFRPQSSPPGGKPRTAGVKERDGRSAGEITRAPPTVPPVVWAACPSGAARLAPHRPLRECGPPVRRGGRRAKSSPAPVVEPAGELVQRASDSTSFGLHRSTPSSRSSAYSSIRPRDRRAVRARYTPSSIRILHVYARPLLTRLHPHLLLLTAARSG